MLGSRRNPLYTIEGETDGKVFVHLSECRLVASATADAERRTVWILAHGGKEGVRYESVHPRSGGNPDGVCYGPGGAWQYENE